MSLLDPKSCWSEHTSNFAYSRELSSAEIQEWERFLAFSVSHSPGPLYYNHAPLPLLPIDSKKRSTLLFFISYPSLIKPSQIFSGNKQYSDLSVLGKQLQKFLISHKLSIYLSIYIYCLFVCFCFKERGQCAIFFLYANFHF